MESLAKQLFRVPTLQSMNVPEPTESFVMVSTCGRVGRGGRGHPQCTYYKRMGHVQEKCFSL